MNKDVTSKSIGQGICQTLTAHSELTHNDCQHIQFHLRIAMITPALYL